jgi:CheY-like chemotaxis protein
MSEAKTLSGRRILVVEDRYLIASEIADLLADLGAEVLGPAPHTAAAAEILRTRRPDAALLDVNLDGAMVFPLAEELVRLGVPIMFLTGYDEGLPDRWRERPKLLKPVDPKLLREAVLQLTDAAAAH